MTPAIYFAKSGARQAPKLPADAVTRTFGIFGMKDSGKTTTGRVIAEGIVKIGGHVVIFDPVGVWWGITRAGEGPGLPGIVIGGEHGDVPLEETGGQLVAELCVARQWPVVVVDLKLMRKGAAQRFMADCLEAIYFTNRRPLHMIFEEADRVLPQSPRGMNPVLGRVMGAAEDIVKLGRSRGLGSTFISQRIATVTKNVVEQVEALILHRQIGPNDLKAVKGWIESNGDPRQTVRVLETIASLAQGEAWLYSPGWLRVLERVRMKMPRTLDSSSTPTDDEREVEEAAKRAPVDLAELRRLMEETVERAAANDPKVLRARIAELEAALEAAGSAGGKVERVEVLVPDPGGMAALSECVASIEAAQGDFEQQLALTRDAVRDAAELAQRTIEPLGEWVSALSGALDTAAALPPAGRVVAPEGPQQPASPRGSSRAAPGADGELSSGARKLLGEMSAVAPLRLTRTQLATLLRRGARSSTLTQQLGELKAAGLIDGADGAGWVVVGADANLVQGDLLARWREALPDGPRALLEVLLHVREVGRDSLFEQAGFSATSSTPVTHLKLLRDNGLVEGRGGGGVVRLGPALASV